MKITKTDKSRLPEVDLNNLPFGKVMSDHMAICHYKDDAWQEPEIVPYANLSLAPSTSALHYGQAVFEGMSAYRDTSSSSAVNSTSDSNNATDEPTAVLFRIRDNAVRISKSLKRLMMPEIPVELFENCLIELIKLDKKWIPEKPGSYLYIRPFVFATDEYVGVKPSSEYTFIIFSAPTGPYYSKKLKVKVEQTYTRAAPGGVGAAKAAGNYAAAMLATAEAQKEGFDQIVWTDSQTHEYIEESGTMNIFCVIDGVVITPKTTDTILAGITRDSVCTVCKELNIPIEERKISVAELKAAMENGTLQGMFGTGTAVTLIEIESVTIGDLTYTLPDLTKTPDGKGGFVGEFYKPALDKLRAIKAGADNEYGWTTKV